MTTESAQNKGDVDVDVDVRVHAEMDHNFLSYLPHKVLEDITRGSIPSYDHAVLLSCVFMYV